MSDHLQDGASPSSTNPIELPASPAALRLLAEIRADHGPVMFHLSGGCCDGSAPMCYGLGELRLGANDLCLGQVAGAEIWMTADHYAALGAPEIGLDALPGKGGMFSLDNGRGWRFVVTSTLCAPNPGPPPPA